nr:hypothetical protein [Tanacetum cinerariifolium]
MDEPAAAIDSSGVPSAVEKSPLDLHMRMRLLTRVLPPRSSQGVAAAGDPESENISSPAEVGSPGSVYRPEWELERMGAQFSELQVSNERLSQQVDALQQQ